MAFPLVEFDPPDSGQMTITWSRALVVFAEALQTSAPNVLLDLEKNIFEPYHDVLPARTSIYDEIEAYLISLLLREFDRRYPITIALPYHPGIRVQQRVMQFLCLSGLGFDQGDPTFPDVLVGMKQEAAENDLKQTPGGYDPRCRLLIQPDCSPWDYLTAAGRDCHPELTAPREAIRAWADKWHLRAKPCFPGWFYDVALSTMHMWAIEGFDGEFWYSGARHKGRCQLFVNDAEETAELPFPLFLSGIPRYRSHHETRDYYMTEKFGNWLNEQRGQDWFKALQTRYEQPLSPTIQIRQHTIATASRCLLQNTPLDTNQKEKTIQIARRLDVAVPNYRTGLC